MKILYIVIIVNLILNIPLSAFSGSWLTWYEQHNKNQTPSYQETLAFSQRLAEASENITITFIGKSPRGREIPLLVYDKDGDFEPESIHKAGKRVLLIQACIHAGEPVGKDAGLMLLRDIVVHDKYSDYLDEVTLLFLPILNVDGHERFSPYSRINQNGPDQMGWRTNALNLNLNRDYLKAESLEIQAFLKMWHHWKPDFFIDAHSTNGGDYQYTMTYFFELFGGANAELVRWIETQYLPSWEETMLEYNYPVFPYVTYRSWHDPRSGLRSGTSNPNFSNGFAAESNRPGLLLETHMLKPYHKRVESTYITFVSTLEILYKDKELKEVIRNADAYTASRNFREKPFPLRFQNTSDSVMVEFLGVEYHKKESSLSGGNWFQYHPDKPTTYTIPWFNKNEVVYDVILPEAYIIPREYAHIAEKLTLHGIEITEIQSDSLFDVEMYRFEDVDLSSRSFEGRQTANFTTLSFQEKRLFPEGSYFVSMNQAGARILAHALEPMSPASLAQWGFFNSVFERTEYFESYVMEVMAREMMEENPELEKELHAFLEENPHVKENPYTLLSWFYEQTPYYDAQYLLYPIGRILVRDF